HARIRQCVELLSEDEIWDRPNTHTISIGNLVLHLSGNIRQWVVSALGGAPDVRHRDAEFSEPGPIPTAELLAGLDATMREAKAASILAKLEPEKAKRITARIAVRRKFRGGPAERLPSSPPLDGERRCPYCEGSEGVCTSPTGGIDDRNCQG
ncbi:MAG: DUF664 domain-containing protein, partial [Chloroflexi bacterium]|nr:DUF664 domain-containing protein [Chloroflexota bacterium]